MKRILILTCSNDKIGFGHYRRSLSLHNYLNKNFHSEFIDLNHVNLNFGSIQCDLVIFDNPYDMSEEVNILKARNIRTIGLDTNYNSSTDLTLSIYEHNQHSHNNRIQNFNFAIIRDEILQLPKEGKNIFENQVLISLGGSDLKKDSLPIAKILLEKGFYVTLVYGPLAKLESFENSNLKIVQNPKNLPSLMHQCDIAITNGGGTLFELLYLHKPVVIIPQTEAEERISAHVRTNGSIIGVGYSYLDNLNSFNPAEFKKNFKPLVDGKGLENITKYIVEVLNAQ
ncbi:glycosyltransferase [Bacteriovorax sp. Seq25_V]|uniref:glycosyltransferase n=1 Tax=Bacteriovorax sp. Seq25_V TaxID=1201288 RepID=UPI00038A1A75|nr:glycosyltransferase [Bacteriovorax sp. Seq25_V]EQC43397.1 glycosyltransferase family 28 C-terminal domain protein [Bacteriovorax sp. Seq25_V]